MKKRDIYPDLKFEDLSVGQILTTHNSGEYEILKLESSICIEIRFIKTNYKKETKLCYLQTGSIKDKRFPSVCGVGYLDGCLTNKHPKEYNHWRMMLHRCYNPNYHAYNIYGGEGVRVDERWHSFKNFVEDFKKIDGYSDYLMSLKKNRHLDKDIKQTKVPNHKKVYSLETCTLIEMKVNQKYKRYNSPTTCFIATDPHGNKHYATNVKQWCKNTGHYQKYIDRCFSGKIGSYKGWKFTKITEEEYKAFYNKL